MIGIRLALVESLRDSLCNDEREVGTGHRVTGIAGAGNEGLFASIHRDHAAGADVAREVRRLCGAAPHKPAFARTLVELGRVPPAQHAERGLAVHAGVVVEAAEQVTLASL